MGGGQRLEQVECKYKQENVLEGKAAGFPQREFKKLNSTEILKVYICGENLCMARTDSQRQCLLSKLSPFCHHKHLFMHIYTYTHVNRIALGIWVVRKQRMKSVVQSHKLNYTASQRYYFVQLCSVCVWQWVSVCVCTGFMSSVVRFLSTDSKYHLTTDIL